ncbi:hypothetical protein NKG05_10170 [Oerskovia sp. M15]
MPTMLATVGGGLFFVVLLASSVLGAAGLRQPSATVPAGTEVSSGRSDVIAADEPLVVVGTTGVTWDDVASGLTPTLNEMLTDGAGAAGLSAHGRGVPLRRGRLAGAVGRSARRGHGRARSGRHLGLPGRHPVTTGDGAVVSGWDGLVSLQRGSSYQARLGVLGSALTTRPARPPSGPELPWHSRGRTAPCPATATRRGLCPGCGHLVVPDHRGRRR